MQPKLTLTINLSSMHCLRSKIPKHSQIPTQVDIFPVFGISWVLTNLDWLLLIAQKFLSPPSTGKFSSKLFMLPIVVHKTTWGAKDLYYWRGMSSEIQLLVHDCDTCCPFLPSQPQEPIMPGISATGPMTDMGSDLFQIGHNHYIVMMDRYSGFSFVEKLSKLSTSAITKVLTTWFNTFGLELTMVSNGDPNLVSFAKNIIWFIRILAPTILRAMDSAKLLSNKWNFFWKRLMKIFQFLFQSLWI